MSQRKQAVPSHEEVTALRDEVQCARGANSRPGSTACRRTCSAGNNPGHLTVPDRTQHGPDDAPLHAESTSHAGSRE